MPDESVKWLGAGSIAFACVAAWFLLRRWPQGHTYSISKHAGAGRTSYFLFAVTLTVCGLCFSIFMWRWFGPAIGAGWPFYAALWLAIILQLLTAWLPDNGSGRGLSRAHALAAFSMAGMMTVLVACVLFAPHVTVAVRMIAVVALLFMIMCWYLFIFVKSSHKHFLIYQTSYIASFYVVVLLATYLR